MRHSTLLSNLLEFWEIAGKFPRKAARGVDVGECRGYRSRVARNAAVRHQ
jgi:hypothetical protein